MITSDKMGGRTVELFIPFELNGKRIERVTFGPFLFGHTMRWTGGEFASGVALMVELAGVDKLVVRSIRYPDVDRVMEAFMSLLTPEIRDDIVNERVPQKTTPEPQPEASKPNGSAGPVEVPLQDLQGPGDPLPQEETGFDLSEEP